MCHQLSKAHLLRFGASPERSKMAQRRPFDSAGGREIVAHKRAGVHVCFVIALLHSNGEASGMHPALVPESTHCRRLHVFWARLSRLNIGSASCAEEEAHTCAGGQRPREEGRPQEFRLPAGPPWGMQPVRTPRDCCTHPLAPSHQQHIALMSQEPFAQLHAQPGLARKAWRASCSSDIETIRDTASQSAYSCTCLRGKCLPAA